MLKDFPYITASIMAIIGLIAGLALAIWIRVIELGI